MVPKENFVDEYLTFAKKSNQFYSCGTGYYPAATDGYFVELVHSGQNSETLQTVCMIFVLELQNLCL